MIEPKTEWIPSWLKPGVYAWVNSHRVRVLWADSRVGVNCLALSGERLVTEVLLDPSWLVLDPNQTPALSDHVPTRVPENEPEPAAKSAWLRPGVYARANVPSVPRLHGQRVLIHNIQPFGAACSLALDPQSGAGTVIGLSCLTPDTEDSGSVHEKILAAIAKRYDLNMTDLRIETCIDYLDDEAHGEGLSWTTEVRSKYGTHAAGHGVNAESSLDCLLFNIRRQGAKR